MSEELVLLGTAIVAASGVPGLLLSRHALSGQCVTTVLAVLGAGVGLMGVGAFWATGASQPIRLPWDLLPSAEFSVAVDGLSAMFLVPIFLISLLGNTYGLGYWKQTEHPQNGCKLRLFYGTMTGGMALLVIARSSILFLFGWEIMALSAFFLVTTEDHDNLVREAGWIYLVATHAATLCLFALFALLRLANPKGSFALESLGPESLTPGLATAISSWR
jgi:formate hydrogenlyase subunit 3/multisubunit Na+/H+ antiporter MnhD subunit